MVTVGAFVAAAGWNMSDEPRLVTMLTERELALPARSVPAGEDPGVQLWIRYQGREDPLDSRNWLSASRLREIGFALHVPAGSPQAIDAYDHVPPRLAWVVFEHDGPQWREIERQRAMHTSEPDPLRPRSGWMDSRLVPVDAGVDLNALQIRYPTGHLILRGVIGLSYVRDEQRGPLLYGRLREVVPQRVAVPYQFRRLLDGMRESPPGSVTEPRYDVELALGSLGMPYVRALRSRAER
jgi:hypothetical protein